MVWSGQCLSAKFRFPLFILKLQCQTQMIWSLMVAVGTVPIPYSLPLQWTSKRQPADLPAGGVPGAGGVPRSQCAHAQSAEAWVPSFRRPSPQVWRELVDKRSSFLTFWVE